MTRIVLLASVLLLASQVGAETRRKHIDHQVPLLIATKGHSLAALDPLAKSSNAYNGRSPIDQATLLLTTLIDSDPLNKPQGPSQDYGVAVRPWFTGRNGVGVKVELTW